MFIVNGKILTMNEEIYESGYVHVVEGKIEAVGDMSELTSEQIDSEVLNVSGAWVMPGLIDAHCHVGISEEKWGMVCDDCNEMTTPITPHLRAIDAVNPMDPAFHDAIMAGITSLMTGPGSSNVVGGQSIFLKVHGRDIDRMVLKAPAAMKVAFGENPKVNYGNKDEIPGTRMAIAAMLREELFKAREYFEQQENGTLEKEDFRLKAWMPVFRHEIPMKVHAHRADDILTAIRIAKEFNLDITLDHCTEGHLIVDEIIQSGYPAIVGPDLASRSKIEIRNMSFKTAGILAKAGIMVSIMTDHPVSLIRYLPICAGLSVKQGLPMEEGLKAITINAAKICGVEDYVGSIEPGKDADISIFTGNPMEIFTKTLYTIVDGEIIYQSEDEGNEKK